MRPCLPCVRQAALDQQNKVRWQHKMLIEKDVKPRRTTAVKESVPVGRIFAQNVHLSVTPQVFC